MEEYGRPAPPRRSRRRSRRRRQEVLRARLILAGLALAALLILVLAVTGLVKLVGVLTAPKAPEPSLQTELQPEAPLPPAEEEETADTLRLIMVGDVLLHDPIQESGQMEDGSWNYDHLFTHTREIISAADLAIVNQEIILGGRELGLSGYPAFNGAFEVGDALAAAGFDVVCHATNHALDKGETGLLNCLNYWHTNHPQMAVLGIHQEEAARDQIYIYEQGGISTAILNFTYGTNGIPLPQPYMVDLLEEERVLRLIDQAEELADFTIVAPHWGKEYTHTPGDEQQYWAERFLAHGVDLVLGTHSHTIQPVEWLKDEQGNKMLVYWSLGNYVNFTSDSGDGVRQRAVGMMADVTLKEAEDGSVVIEQYDALPLVSHMVRGAGQPTAYLLEDYTEELAAENEMSRKDSGFSLSWCKELCSQVLGQLYE